VKTECVFELVPADGALELDEDRWLKIQFQLLEFQPARRVWLVGPPTRIRVEAPGEPEIAPAILARVEELAGTAMRLEPVSPGDS
jgi:hypothetical protein